MSSKMVIIPFDRYQRMLESKGDVACQSTDGVCNSIDTISNHIPPMHNKTGLSRDVIFLFIPAKIRPKVETLLSLNYLDWNEKGEIISGGKTVKNSHIAD